jgi:demethoxyubiquinone hydroxylase (CLK1/Coq7/Cat5 family)
VISQIKPLIGDQCGHSYSLAVRSQVHSLPNIVMKLIYQTQSAPSLFNSLYIIYLLTLSVLSNELSINTSQCVQQDKNESVHKHLI